MKQAESMESAPDGAVDPVILEVRTRFVADFPRRCDVADSLVDRAAKAETRQESAESLRTIAHRIAGLAGIIGFQRVSVLASELEDVASNLGSGAAAPGAAHALVDSLRAAFAHHLADGDSADSGTKGTDRGCVLIAEDDGDQRAVVMHHLANAGYRTEGVDSGSLVVNAARAVRPSVVLLDIELPGLDGYAVCRELKADAELATVPVVFMSTRARLDDRLAGLALGADDYLVKPVDPDELILRLERVRTRDTARAEQAAAAGALSYDEFLSVARSRLARSAASVALIRTSSAQLQQTLETIREEVRRADIVGVYDRTHVLLLLPELTGAAARAQTNELIARLGQRGIPDVTAGIAFAPTANSIWIESLICDADSALLQARYCSKAVAVFGETVAPSTAPAGASILVADDDPDVMRILDAQLRGAGHRTTLAFDGAEALSTLQHSHPDVLILDLMMPKVSGFDLLERLNRADGPRPKILVLSARGREDDVTRAFELGADDYVTKPFNPRELLARVARLLR
jgi:DNA-binding response OmpR family regulator